MSVLVAVVVAGLTAVSAVQEPGAAAVPSAVTALAGCWTGTGAVLGKPVTIELTARPVAENALFLIETESEATADPADRYAAHLIFGGRTPSNGGSETISAFWADSFGGDYTAVGAGAPREDGFEVSYAYPDARFVNRWALTTARLTWTIVAKDSAGAENRFAAYEMTRTACSPS
ncbi:hypothetical protein [Brevundimonas sp.]|jgi:hypothetical protein|uniref:hypothetical protein n=1 Tax=Brevundimonas sp. TaxID=1871086 RepID=UPI0037C08934